ncbi:hypothetical protein [Acidianus brierleyi]|uniref:Uncharacterized protein n=1 Tax=Acidianus brierleyi TaxID=41673 RepID=A0A2U9IB86_9CREN|nr:hypothetical protein [Acidianus brierleyi]AWR93286.1 hypothetical protein DFR85_00330 [Acidianus brierleyi]
MDNIISTFILVIATIIIGLIALGLFGGYFGIQASNINNIKQAQEISMSLQIRELQISNSSGINFVIYPFIPSYNIALYIVAFQVSSSLQNSQTYVTPLQSEGWVNVNYTIGSYRPIVVYSDSGSVLYNGNAYIYSTHSNSVQFIYLKNGENAILWFIVNLNGQYYRIGYVWISG